MTSAPHEHRRLDDEDPHEDRHEPWHEHRLRVRYAETDQMGRAHHANYLLYMEEGRTRMMRERGCSYAELEKRGIGLPVRRAELRYRGGAAYDDEILVRTRVEAIGNATVTFAYEIVRASDGAPLATGSTELACVDMRRTPPKPTGLPHDVRAALG